MLCKLVLVLPAVLLVLAGCGGTSLPTMPALPSAADAQKAVCDSLATVASRLDQLANVNPSMTVAEIKSLKAPIDTAVQAIAAANQVLNQANITELTTAYDNLTASINGLPDNAAVGETAARIQAAAVTVRDALVQARTALTCP